MLPQAITQGSRERRRSGRISYASSVLILLVVGGALCGGSALRLPSLDLQRSIQSAATGVTRTQVTPKAKDFADGDDLTVRNHWALLVAGSSGWGNYRHQADVCHSYQVLLRGGLRPAHMVVMVYDDIADDPENPAPGQVFNAPGGPDVYSGVRIDYRGADVSAPVFLAVLEGNASALPPGTAGSGRVLASGPMDRIFVFYSDHGAPGVLGMPSGSFLYADELVGALQRKYQRRGYKEAVLYIEACESGSMFEGMLPAGIAAYATTASNAMESSWGCYCPGMVPGPPPAFSTCLGDLYSVAWMENAEDCDLTHETLMAQYSLVRNRTSNNYTYSMGSHVMQYGSMAISREVAGDYEGMHNRGQAGGSGRGGGDVSETCRAAPGPGPDPSPSPEPGPGPEPTPVSTPWSDIRPSTPTQPAGAAWAALAGAARAALGRASSWSGADFTVAVQPTLRSGSSSGGSSRQRQASGAAALALHPTQQHHAEQREADLAPLRHGAMHGATPARRAAAAAKLERETARRRGLDSAALAAAEDLLRRLPHLAATVAPHVRPTADVGAANAAGSAAANSVAGKEGQVDSALLALMAHELVYGPVRRPATGPTAPGRRLTSQGTGAGSGSGPAAEQPQPPAGVPLVDDWDCLRAMVAAWGDACGPMGQYAMRHTRMLAALCNAHVAPATVAEALRNGGCATAGAATLVV